MLVQGVAMSVFFVSMITITLNGIPAHKIPAATGLSNFTRLIAGGFAASLTTTIWDRSESVHQTRLAETVAATSPNWAAALRGLHNLGAPCRNRSQPSPGSSSTRPICWPRSTSSAPRPGS